VQFVSSENGDTEVVKILLADPRVSPQADDDFAIRWSSRYGHTEVVKIFPHRISISPCRRCGGLGCL